MKLKRLVSLVTALALSFALAAPASAAVIDKTAQENDLQTEIISIDGENTKIRCREENGALVYVEVGSDVVERKGNEVFLNGAKIATITTTSNLTSSAIEPRTGWIYGDGTCPMGYSPSDYNKLYDTRSHNITFEEEVGKWTRDILLATLILIVPFVREITGKEVFAIVAGTILDHIADFSDEENCVYATEYIYSGGMPYTHKNAFYFYSDKAKTKPTGNATCYSSWA